MFCSSSEHKNLRTQKLTNSKTARTKKYVLYCYGTCTKVPIRKTLKKQNKNKKKHVFFCFPMFPFVFPTDRLAAKTVIQVLPRELKNSRTHELKNLNSARTKKLKNSQT